MVNIVLLFFGQMFRITIPGAVFRLIRIGCPIGFDSATPAQSDARTIQSKGHVYGCPIQIALQELVISFFPLDYFRFVGVGVREIVDP